MSRNRHASSLRKFNKAPRRNQIQHGSNLAYEPLEDRKLLAVDFTSIPTDLDFGGGSRNSVGVGPEHVVAVQNGQLRIYNKSDGSVAVTKPLAEFWLETGGAGGRADTEMVGNISDPSVLYDADTRRWFLSSVSDIDVITGADGVQNPVLLAVSRTSNPTETWHSTGYLYDVDDDPMTPPIPYDGGFLPFGGDTAGVNLSVDDHNVYLNVDVANPFAPDEIWALNKFSDLVVPNSTALNAAAFVSPDNQLEWGMDSTGTLPGSFGLSTRTGGNFVRLTEFSNPASTATINLEPIVNVPVSMFTPPPINVRQEFDPDLRNSRQELTASVVRRGDSLWAAHAILASNGINSAIRWYEIDLVTKTVAQWGTIEDNVTNYMYPSIAITPKGHVAIGHTSTGFSLIPGEGQFPSASVSIGYDVNGVMTFEAPVNIADGDAGYLDNVGNLWSESSIAIDPNNDPDSPDKVWVLAPWSAGMGKTQLAELTLTGHSPTLVANPTDDLIVVRRSAGDPTQIEVLFNGVLQTMYQESSMFRITVDGGGGLDTFVLDTINGELNLPSGVEFVGDGNDIVRVDSPLQTNWTIGRLPAGFEGTNEGGSGFAAVGSTLDPDCQPAIVNEVVFNLNFIGNIWNDATPWLGGTYGDAIRAAVQNYFDNVLAPVFDGNYSLSMDITDSALTALSSSMAFGGQFFDIAGQQIWASAPFSILTGRGDSNGASADAKIDFNVDFALYGGDNAIGRQALLDNLDGLTRFEFLKVLGMESFIPNQTTTSDPRGGSNIASVMDLGLRDLNDAPLIGNYSPLDNEFDVLNYSVNGSWAGDTSGLYFRGIGDTGLELKLPVNSNAVLIDFDAMAFTFAGTSRNGAFDQIIEQDRAFLRGLGYSLAPVVPPVTSDGNNIYFSGADVVFGGTGVDHFCVTSINFDFSINGRSGNDTFVMTAVGGGALNLSGNSGDDIYEVRVGGGSVVTVIDSVGSENDRLLGVGTANNDSFAFDTTGVTINGGLLVFSGIEDVNFDGQAGDDLFTIRVGNPDLTKIVGGAGLDKFLVSRVGSNNSDTLRISTVAGTMTNQLQLDISSVITDSYRSESVEVFQVDGNFIIDDLNGVPTVAGGLQLMGDGNDSVTLESNQTADWLVNGNGSGMSTVSAVALAFMGIGSISGGHHIDNFVVTMTNTGMLLRGREGNDSFVLDNSGTGVVTMEGNLGLDTFSLLRTGGGGNLSGNEGNDSVTINLSGPGTGAVSASGGTGDDFFRVINSGAAAVKMFGDADNDTFVVANVAGNSLVEAHGGAGNDQFTVLNSGLGRLELFGELGDDTYSISFVAPANIFRIIDSVNAENDVLTAGVGTSGNDVFTLNSTLATFAGANWEIVGIESYSFDGLAGDDTFNISLPAGSNANLAIVGGLGNDRMIVNQTGGGLVQLSGGSGNDYYEVHFSTNSNVTINDTSGTDALRGVGTSGDDLLNLTSSSANVNGGTLSYVGLESVEYLGLGGNDVFNVTSAIGNSLFSGGFGNDVFNVAMTTDGNRYAGDDGNDVFNIASTTATAEFSGGNGEDVFNVNATTGGGTFLGDAGNDIFNIGASTGVSIYRGGADNDMFVVTDRLPLGSAGAIDIDGESGFNQLTVNGYETAANVAVVTTTSITGMTAVPIDYRATGGTFSLPNGDVGGIVLIGSDSIGDGFAVNSFANNNSMRLLGRGGNDIFTLYAGALGKIQAEGGEGTDLYQFAVGTGLSRRLSVVDTGLIGTDRLVVTATTANDDLVLFGQSFTLKTDQVSFDQNLEALIVDMKGGNDIVSVGRMNVGFVRVLLGAGADRINVGDLTGITSGVSIDGGTEQDIFSFANSLPGNFAQAFGGSGNDLFVVGSSALGTVFLDGQNGSDNYDISLGGTVRTSTVRDTGTTFTDVDRLQVNGTSFVDNMEMHANLVRNTNQRVVYDNKVETLSVRTGAGADRVAVHGTSARNTNLSTENDQDTVTIFSIFGSGLSRNLNVDLGAGDDVATARFVNEDSIVSIAGGAGNDLINLGSTQAENNGYLQFIAGTLSLVGNDGSDRIYVNDFGTAGVKNYRVNSNSLTQFSGANAVLPGSIFYSGIENLRLDGTSSANRVNVTSSIDTAFEFFGRAGGNTILLDPIDAAIDGRVLTMTSATSGRWTFTNGKRDIFFTDFTVI